MEQQHRQTISGVGWGASHGPDITADQLGRQEQLGAHPARIDQAVADLKRIAVDGNHRGVVPDEDVAVVDIAIRKPACSTAANRRATLDAACSRKRKSAKGGLRLRVH